VLTINFQIAKYNIYAKIQFHKENMCERKDTRQITGGNVTIANVVFLELPESEIAGFCNGCQNLAPDNVCTVLGEKLQAINVDKGFCGAGIIDDQPVRKFANGTVEIRPKNLF
jgi:hypothetical protein